MFNDIFNVYLLKMQGDFLLRICFNIVHKIIDEVLLDLGIDIGISDILFFDIIR